MIRSKCTRSLCIDAMHDSLFGISITVDRVATLEPRWADAPVASIRRGGRIQIVIPSRDGESSHRCAWRLEHARSDQS